jgi:hypothetical protein
MSELGKPLLPIVESTPVDIIEAAETGGVAAKPQKIAPPGSMEHEFWMAEDFDEPIDNLFNCLQDTSHDPLDQG